MTANDSDAAPELARSEASSGDSETDGIDGGTRGSSKYTTAVIPTEAR